MAYVLGEGDHLPWSQEGCLAQTRTPANRSNIEEYFLVGVHLCSVFR